MFKGFIAGLLWGFVLAGSMVVVANEMAVTHELTGRPVAAAVELPAGSAFDAVRDDTPPEAPADGDAQPAGSAPAVVPGATGREALPRTGGSAQVPAVPEAGAQAPEATVPGSPGSDGAPTPTTAVDGRPELAPAADLSGGGGQETLPERGGAAVIPAAPVTGAVAPAVSSPDAPAGGTGAPQAVTDSRPGLSPAADLAFGAQREALPGRGTAARPPAVPSTGDAPPLVAAPGSAYGAGLAFGASDDARPGLAPAASLIADTPDRAPAPSAAPPVAPHANAPAVTAETAVPLAPSVEATPAPVLPSGGDRPAAIALPDGLVSDAPQGAGVEVASNEGFGGAAPDLPPAPSAGVTRPVAPAEVALLDIPAPEGPAALPAPGAPAPPPEAPAAPAVAEPGAGAVRVAEQAPQPLAEEDPAEVLTPAQEAARRIPTGRLVQAGVADETQEAETEVAADEDLPEDALSRNAAEFENPQALPLLSIVLLDAGDLPLELPFQASFVIDPLAADANTRAQAYRAAGHDVLVLPALPKGASATDAAQAMEGSRGLLDQSVALIASPGAAENASRVALDQVVSEAGRTGHGLVTFPRGLNTAQRLAERAGVVTGVVFRDIDDGEQDAGAVKRFLDQAAFRARQEGAVIVFARVRPETMAGLAEWVLGNRAQSVRLAPVSAALKAGAGS